MGNVPLVPAATDSYSNRCYRPRKVKAKMLTKFLQTRFPAELEGRISEEQFLFTVNMMNKMYAEAEKVCTQPKGGCAKSQEKRLSFA